MEAAESFDDHDLCLSDDLHGRRKHGQAEGGEDGEQDHADHANSFDGDLVLPIRDENVRLARFRIKTIRRPHDLMSVRTELRETVEVRVSGDLLEPGAVRVHEI